MSVTADPIRAFTPNGPQLARSLSLRLLTHRGLMTPRLKAVFGAMRAEQATTKQGDEGLTRTSRLVSIATGHTILRAKLHIVDTHLPVSLVQQLCETSELFGQLLHDHDIDVAVAEPQLFQTPDGCFGRTTTLTEAASNLPICDVIETLSHDDQLAVIAKQHTLAKSQSQQAY